MSHLHLVEFPLNFNKSSVDSDFNCSHNRLISLKGCPKEIRNFNCSYNQLTSLEGSSEHVSGWFDCNTNQLTTLIGGPKKVWYYYWAQNNNLLDVNGFPDHFRSICYLDKNPVFEVLSLLKDEDRIKFIKYLNELDVIHGNKIDEAALGKAYYMVKKLELPQNKKLFRNYQLI